MSKKSLLTSEADVWWLAFSRRLVARFPSTQYFARERLPTTTIMRINDSVATINKAFEVTSPEVLRSKFARYPMPFERWLDHDEVAQGQPCFIASEEDFGINLNYVYCKHGPVGKGMFTAGSLVREAISHFSAPHLILNFLPYSRLLSSADQDKLEDFAQDAPFGRYGHLLVFVRGPQDGGCLGYHVSDCLRTIAF